MSASSSPGRRLAAAAVAAGAAGGAALLASRARRARADAGPLVPSLQPGRTTTVPSADGTSIHVEEFGPPEGPPLVLVHAWMCSLELWHRQIEELAGETRIITFDLRGHGRSGLSAGADYSIESFADDLEAVLADRLADGERAVLAGHSMGAMTIAAWAHRHPESVTAHAEAAAMIGTGLGDLVSESLIVRTPVRMAGAKERIEVALLCTEIPFDDAPEFAMRAGARYLAFGPDAREEDVALVARMVRACPRRGARALWRDALARGGLRRPRQPRRAGDGPGGRRRPDDAAGPLREAGRDAPPGAGADRGAPLGTHGAARGRRARHGRAQATASLANASRAAAIRCGSSSAS